MGGLFLSKSVSFLHEVQIGEKVLVLMTTNSLLHGKDDHAALNVESMVLLLQIGLA